MLKKANTTLPFTDTKELDKQKKGSIAPIRELRIHGIRSIWPQADVYEVAVGKAIAE